MRSQKPRITERRNPAGSISYCVDAGLQNGKRHRRFFALRKDAEEYARQAYSARREQGKLAFSLTPKQQVQAAEAFSRIEPLGVSLGNIVDFYLKHAQPKCGTKLISDVLEEFLTSKRNSGKKERYVNILRITLRKFLRDFVNRNANEVHSSEIEEWLDRQEQHSQLTRKNYIRDISMLFNFAVKRGYSSENPVRHIERPRPVQGNPGILTVPQAFRLLSTAHAFPDLEMVPFISIGLFAGLRASEISDLTWAEINLERRSIEIKAENAKTGRRRLVDISDNLLQWLLPHGKEGPVAPPGWRNRLQALARSAEINPWPRNCLRHSYGSYHLAKFENANRTALQMGHESEKMLFRHYREIVHRQSADEFWNILPPSGNEWFMLPPMPGQKTEFADVNQALATIQRAIVQNLKTSQA